MTARMMQTIIGLAILAAWMVAAMQGLADDLPLSQLIPILGAWLAPSPVTITRKDS